MEESLVRCDLVTNKIHWSCCCDRLGSNLHTELHLYPHNFINDMYCCAVQKTSLNAASRWLDNCTILEKGSLPVGGDDPTGCEGVGGWRNQMIELPERMKSMWFGCCDQLSLINVVSGSNKHPNTEPIRQRGG